MDNVQGLRTDKQTRTCGDSIAGLIHHLISPTRALKPFLERGQGKEVFGFRDSLEVWVRLQPLESLGNLKGKQGKPQAKASETDLSVATRGAAVSHLWSRRWSCLRKALWQMSQV